MKKLMFLLAVAGVLSACQTKEEPKPTNSNAIAFRTLTGTRVGSTDVTNIKSFRLFGKWWVGDMTTRPAAAPQTFDYAYAIDVTRENQSDVWHYSPQLYWPVEGSVNFYAYSPAGSVNIYDPKINGAFWEPSTETYYPSGPGYPYFGYKNPDISEAKQQEDLLVATVKNQNKTVPGVSAVQLKFFHALSQAKVIAKNTTQDITFVVEDLMFMNLYSKAFMLAFLTNDVVNIPANSAINWNSEGIPYNVYSPVTFPDYAPFPMWVTGFWGNHQEFKNYSTLIDGNIYVAPDADNRDADAKNDNYKQLGQTIAIIPQINNSHSATAVDNTVLTIDPSTYLPHITNQYLAIKYKVLYAGSGEEQTTSHWALLKYELEPYNEIFFGTNSAGNYFETGIRYTFVLNFDDSWAQRKPILFSVDVEPWIEIGFESLNSR